MRALNVSVSLLRLGTAPFFAYHFAYHFLPHTELRTAAHTALVAYFP